MRVNDTTYDFLCDIETMVYDFSKSFLVDVGLSKFSPSLVVAGGVFAAIEIITYKSYYREKTNS